MTWTWGHFGVRDALLIGAVSIQATTLAYLHSPRQKALIFSLPIPFTMATLALGRPVDATNVLALILVLFFTHAVRGLHVRAGVPVVPAIVLSALAYCVLGGSLAQVVPPTDAAFWTAWTVVVGLGWGLHRVLPHRQEPGHRSPLPVWVKLIVVSGVISFLVLIKEMLGGFMTLFPMVGVVAAYEARHSLWTLSRQVPVLMMTIGAMMAACRLLQSRIGLGPALVVGWAVFLVVLATTMGRELWHLPKWEAGFRESRVSRKGDAG